MATPALADKLDTDEVNGPRDDELDWDAIFGARSRTTYGPVTPPWMPARPWCSSTRRSPRICGTRRPTVRR